MVSLYPTARLIMWFHYSTTRHCNRPNVIKCLWLFPNRFWIVFLFAEPVSSANLGVVNLYRSTAEGKGQSIKRRVKCCRCINSRCWTNSCVVNVLRRHNADVTLWIFLHSYARMRTWLNHPSYNGRLRLICDKLETDLAYHIDCILVTLCFGVLFCFVFNRFLLITSQSSAPMIDMHTMLRCQLDK